MQAPNFERFRTVLSRAGEPDLVPLGDIGIHPLHKVGVLGRPIRGLADEVAFWSCAGYAVASSNSVPEYVPLANFNAMREATFEYGRYPIGV
jgi:hypothetical protein